MKRRNAAACVLAAFALCAAIGSAVPAHADTILYEFAALRGPASLCQWFDNEINDRSLGAMIRQTDLIYNRTTLEPGTTVTNVQTLPVNNGTQVAGFDAGRTLLCSGDDALNPSAPEAASPPTPSP
ncbi:MAG TPA: hypothetical protein VMH02_10110 [Verrucomicrobiae bacterium]|nr:hypothetical protein [Verrucomicrobiae bacterium]